MKVYMQWAKNTAEDWKPVNITTRRNVQSLKKRGIPNSSNRVDDQDGWYCAINCQGITFSGYDHVAIDVIQDGLRITGWQDDTEDFGDTRWATEWTLLEPAPDDRINGLVNTRQVRRIWGTDDVKPWFTGVDVLPWDEFIVPPASLTFHGIWLPDELYVAHAKTRSVRNWREWVVT